MTSTLQTRVRVNAGGLIPGSLRSRFADRRGFLRLAAGAGAVAGLRWGDCLGAYADELKKQDRACILLWMAGGPSQFESLDPKPGAETQGPTTGIDTAVPGLQFAEHWPHAARIAKDLAVIRSMTGRERNHGRATYLLHTSH